MFTKTPLCILGFAVSGASQDNCGEVQWRQVKPSKAGAISANTTDQDAPHFVTSQPTTGASDILRVFLPGTFNNPSQGTHLLNAFAGDFVPGTLCREGPNRPTIGLSYNFIPLPDGARNDLCFQTLRHHEAQIGCLALQHHDGLWGSEPGRSGLWESVAEQDSAGGRLTRLLVHLDEQFPDEGWARFRDGDAPRWDRIMVAGHSQGAGHTAYLAQTTRLAGAALISGPQDECEFCPSGPDNLWLAQPWATRHVRAVHHVDESAGDIISNNWRRMASSLGWPAEPTDLPDDIVVNIQSPIEIAITHAQPQSSYTGVRPHHVSMFEDDATPMYVDKRGTRALYELGLWPALFADPPDAITIVIV